jgi:hypothetical protein
MCAGLCALRPRPLANVLLISAAKCTRRLLRGLTFELRGRQRQDARPGRRKMYTVPCGRAWWPAVGAPLERGVRPHS